MVRPPIKSIIKRDIYIYTLNKTQPSLPPCEKKDLALLWDTPSPKGYFNREQKWESLLCSNEQTMSTISVENCLRNTNVRIFGDSNGWLLFNVFNSLMKPDCKQPSASSRKGAKLTMWNVHTVCERPQLNFNLTFDPHKAHLYAKTTDSTPIEKAGDVTASIDNIPKNGRYLVLVHYYLHLTAGHLAVAHQRLLKLRQAVERASARNPHLLVAFRGPHIIAVDWVDNHSLGGDVQSIFYYRMVKDVFRDMRDKVVFLDGWEMSIAIENSVIHPDDMIPRAMVNTVLSYFC